MASDRLVESIIKHEGSVRDDAGLHVAYRDHLGKLTIGYGCLLDERLTITDKMARELLLAELVEKEERLHAVVGWKESGVVRRQVILELAYWLGVGGLLRFTRFWGAVRGQDWPTAAKELRDSRTWRDPHTKLRMDEMARRIESGAW